MIFAIQIETYSCLHVPCISWYAQIYGIVWKYPKLQCWISSSSLLFEWPFGGFHSHGGTSIAGWFIRKNPIINGWFGGIPIDGHLHFGATGAPHHSSERTASWSCCLAASPSGRCCLRCWRDMRVSIDGGTPKSSMLVGVSLINHPAIGVPIFQKPPYENFVWKRNMTWISGGKRIFIECNINIKVNFAIHSEGACEVNHIERSCSPRTPGYPKWLVTLVRHTIQTSGVTKGNHHIYPSNYPPVRTPESIKIQRLMQ